MEKRKEKRGSYFKTRYEELEKYKKDLKERIGHCAGFLGVYRTELVDVITGKREVKFYHNIIPTVAFTMITNNLTDGTPDNDMLITHALLGDDDTAVAITDTKLGNETYRNAIASRTNSTNIAYATGYFNQTECSGTFKEAGIVSDGTLTPDTGVLVSHVNIDVTKTLTQKLTIDWALTLINA